MEKDLPENNITTLFDDLQEGLIQAIDYAHGTGSARVFTGNIDPKTDVDKSQLPEMKIQPETK